MINPSLLSSTSNALSQKLLTSIAEKHFCIVGCGGVGANFAEMLVRTGATRITLIDGDIIEATNLNRCFSFVMNDVGKKKVVVLANHLRAINAKIDVTAIASHFDLHSPGDEKKQDARDAIKDSEIVLIATDDNHSRQDCYKLCLDAQLDFLSAGIGIDKKLGTAFYECTWKPELPPGVEDQKGYGVDNGSYGAIVLEATCALFHLMMHKLECPDSAHMRLYREYKQHRLMKSETND